MSFENAKLPPLLISFSRKNKAWRKQHLDWADSKSFFNYNPVRTSTVHKKINYDLLIGKLHPEDLEMVLNPNHLKEKTTPTNIQHYPIMNTKLDVLKGEEISRVFDYRVVITNPLAITEKENTKKEEVYAKLQLLVLDQSQSQEQYEENINKMSDYFTYEWLDMREIKANQLLNHYWKEYNMSLMFSDGFMDALTVGEEIYQCDIRGGEPVIERVNPLKIRIFRSGYSNKVEDADIIILEDYWSPAKVIDVYGDVLSKKDMQYLEDAPDYPNSGNSNSMGERDETLGFVNTHMLDDTFQDENFYFDPYGLFPDTMSNSLMPFDTAGNIRVLRMYWKSRRKIKKVKSYNLETGEEIFTFYPENYVIDEAKGEEEKIYYINEAWEGTKIGEEIYVNMRPRIIQYNRLSNPSRCHFGIVGSLYSLNDNRPFSLVDRMKPYNYLYDAIHDRINKLLAKSWGRIMKVDLSLIPKGWDMDKWLYFARVNNIAVVNSFNEGDIGAATGKLAGAMNNASNGVIDAELGSSIQQCVSLLEFIKMEMSEIGGINRQREGQISNRETVGGVERATLQSSHITEWLFATHEDVKKRVLECFLETAKIAVKGRSIKFQYILSDGSMKVSDIDGDEFAEADYGLIVDNTNGTLKLNQELETLALAALLNQALDFATIMKLYTSVSTIEKQRMVEKSEKDMRQRQEQLQQLQIQAQQEQAQMMLQLKQQEMLLQADMNAQDNETKLMIAQIQAQTQLLAKANDWVQNSEYSPEVKDKLLESMRQFDAQLALDREKFGLDKQRLELDKKKAAQDYSVKKEALKRKPATTSSSKK